MNAIITVVGKDGKGIIAAVSARCAEVGANIIEISQSVLKEYFAMIMMVSIEELSVDFSAFFLYCKVYPKTCILIVNRLDRNDGKCI